MRTPYAPGTCTGSSLAPPRRGKTTRAGRLRLSGWRTGFTLARTSAVRGCGVQGLHPVRVADVNDVHVVAHGRGFQRRGARGQVADAAYQHELLANHDHELDHDLGHREENGALVLAVTNVLVPTLVTLTRAPRSAVATMAESAGTDRPRRGPQRGHRRAGAARCLGFTGPVCTSTADCRQRATLADLLARSARPGHLAYRPLHEHLRRAARFGRLGGPAVASSPRSAEALWSGVTRNGEVVDGSGKAVPA